MGLIQETSNHPTIRDVSIVVDQKSPDEQCEPYEIVGLDIGFADIRTPQELIELGNWLISEGNRIKKQYTSTGKKRKAKS